MFAGDGADVVRDGLRQGVPALVPGRPGQREDVGREDARPPVDAEEPVAAVAQGVGGVAAHPAGPELGRGQRGVVLHPGDGPEGPALDAGEARVDRRLADLAVDRAHGHVLGQDLVEKSAVRGRTEDPAAGGQLERRGGFPPSLDAHGQVRGHGLDRFRLGVVPGPALPRPEPVIIDGIGRGDASEHRLVEVLDDGRVLGIAAGGDQALPDGRGHRQGRLRPDAGLDAEAPGQRESVLEDGGGPVEDLVLGRGAGRVGAEAVHDVVPEVVPLEEQARAEMEVAGPLRLVAPVAPGGVLVARRIGGRDLPVCSEIALAADPDGRFGVGGRTLLTARVLGIGVETEEVHPQLGQLAQDGLVVLERPPVRPLGEIVERLDAADGEEGPARLVEIEGGRRDLPVRDDVALEGEADAELFGQLVGAVEHGRSAAAGDKDGPAGAGGHGLQPVVLGTQGGQLGGRGGIAPAAGERAGLLEDGHRPGRDAGQGPGLPEGRELARRQVEIAADLGGGGPLVPGGVPGDENAGDGALPRAGGREGQGHDQEDERGPDFFPKVHERCLDPLALILVQACPLFNADGHENPERDPASLLENEDP